MKNNKGFSIVEGILVLLVVAVIGFVGYMAYTNFFAPDSNKSTTETSEGNNTEPVVVEDSSDLDTAIDELDGVPIDDSSDATELDSAADEFSA